MRPVTVPLAPYSDECGNRIVYEGPLNNDVQIVFRGKNNVVNIDSDASIKRLKVSFDCNNGTFSLGANRLRPRALTMSARVGQDASVKIGDDVTSTSMVIVSAVEGVSVEIGDDVMFATNNAVRADDAHPIFDVRTGKRVNPSASIRISDHVWLAFGAIVLRGSHIGEGSVIGSGSIVTGNIPNNVVAVGSPARVVRRDIAWERPHLSLARPFYKPDASSLSRKSRYWNVTRADRDADDDSLTVQTANAAPRHRRTGDIRSRSISTLRRWVLRALRRRDVRG